MPIATDSSNYYKVRGSEFTNRTTYAISLWFYIPTGTSSCRWVFSDDDTPHLSYSSSALRFAFDNTSAITIGSYSFGDVSKDAWHHIILSGTSGSTPTVYIDGEAVTPTVTTSTAGTLKLDSKHWVLGTVDATWQSLIIYDDTLDLTDATVRGRFYLPASRNQENPMPSGAEFLPNGENGRAPIIAIGTNGLFNYGEGPNPILVGSPQGTTVDDPTSEYWSAQGFIGEEWRECALCGWVFPISELAVQPETKLLVCTTGTPCYDPPAKDGKGPRSGVFVG